MISLALRYRRGDQRLRQQMKWLFLAIAALLVTIVVGGLAVAVGQENKPLQNVPYAIVPFLVLLGIPAAMAIAILRRRLFDIDVIISRALLFTLLSAGVTAVYAAIALTAFLSYVTLAAASGIERRLAQTGMRILTRLMGLVLCAIAVQFIIDGIRMAGL